MRNQFVNHFLTDSCARDRDQWLAIVNIGSVNFHEIPEYLSDWWFLKDLAP
jgi:hypothetical protein